MLQCAAFTQHEDAKIRVGLAGWSYEDWKGIVYPEPMPRGSHALDLLSAWFDTVEINVSFYRPMVARQAATWVAKVTSNPNFMFTAKLWQRFTHQRDTKPSVAEITQVKEGMRPLLEAGRLGAVLVQFPWSFKRNAKSRLWLAWLAETFSEYPMALEVRHSSWDRPEVHEALAERNIALCNIDQPIFDDSIAPADTVTSPLGYVRFHGRNHAAWFRQGAGRNERYNYLYSEEELKPWVERIEKMKKRVSDLYIITNNHYQGQAVVNAIELQTALGGRPILDLPEHLLARYPRLGHTGARNQTGGE